MRRWYVGAVVALAAVTVGSAGAQTLTETQAWPTKPVRVISPIGAGSAADILSRVFSEQLSTQLGQPVVVENRPGAGGTHRRQWRREGRARRLHAAHPFQRPHDRARRLPESAL